MIPDPRELAESLQGHRVRVTFTNGQTREGTMHGAGEKGFTILSGIGGAIRCYYGETDNIEDLGAN